MTSGKKKNACCVVFAKAPIPGYAKNRLAGKFGKRGAVTLYRRMLRHLLERLRENGINDIILYTAPHGKHPFFHSCRRTFQVQLKRQQGDDLGERMRNAMQESLRQYQFCIITGADVPEFEGKNFYEAVKQLESGKDVVFTPAFDGGYVMIGMSKLHREVFRGIPWGKKNVMDVTRKRLNQPGKRYFETIAGFDVDTPADIQRIRKKGILKR